jgi:hypothetical protein
MYSEYDRTIRVCYLVGGWDADKKVKSLKLAVGSLYFLSVFSPKFAFLIAILMYMLSFTINLPRISFIFHIVITDCNFTEFCCNFLFIWLVFL